MVVCGCAAAVCAFRFVPDKLPISKYYHPIKKYWGGSAQTKPSPRPSHFSFTKLVVFENKNHFSPPFSQVNRFLLWGAMNDCFKKCIVWICWQRKSFWKVEFSQFSHCFMHWIYNNCSNDIKYDRETENVRFRWEENTFHGGSARFVHIFFKSKGKFEN